MALVVMKRCVAIALRALPGRVHRALDGWSYRVALKRRERRLKLAK